MQNRFYGDRKDVIKWSLALGAAQPTSQIVYAAMMRPDDGPQGQDFRVPDASRPEVVQFFDQERGVFGPDPAFRVVDRIADLDDRIHLVGDIYTYDQQMTYFTNLVDGFLPVVDRQHSVVLVDPDNGVRQNGAANNRDARVSPNELALVWQAMNRGDVLIVYQTPWRWDPTQRVALADEHRYDPPRTLLAIGLGVPVEAVEVQDFGDVGFLLAYKS